MLGSLDRAMEHGREIVSEFNDALNLDSDADDYDDALVALVPDSEHARLAAVLNLALFMVLQAQRTFESFSMRAYGNVPDKIERWTGTGQDWRKQQARTLEDGPGVGDDETEDALEADRLNRG